MHETPPKLHGCARCFAVTIECWAEGFHVILDVIALDLRGQLEARLAGRYLWELILARPGHTRRLPKPYLVFRDATRIETGRPCIALADHRCGETLIEHADPAQMKELNDWLYPAPIRATAEEMAPPF